MSTAAPLDIAGHRIAREIRFGPFRLQPERQLLLEGEKPVRIGSRALEILVALVEQPGEVLTKNELLTRVWPNLVVDEGNLRAQIALLRRALNDGRAGARYVIAVPGRGYRFVAPVVHSGLATALPAVAPVAAERSQRLPKPTSRVIGRDGVVAEAIRRLERRRLLTIVGPGGIGKTTVALTIADQVTAAYADGVFFIDLAAVSNSIALSSVVAAALGLAVTSDDPISEVIDFLRSRQILLVLDSCEHVLEAASALAESVLRGTTDLRVLATSRELLRAEGENVHHLEPLDTPPEAALLTARQALAFPAVELFVERARSSTEALEITDETMSLVSSICRKLDGMALAIELAASRVHTFGLQGLHSQLHDRFRLLTQERRTALPRHRTLAAALDWSYQYLDRTEQAALRRLAIFVGGFTLEAAQAVVVGQEEDAADVIRAIADLVAKSLVSVNAKGQTPIYRLLDTTRAYTIEKLVESGEFAATARRHADHYRAVLVRAGADAEAMGRDEWLMTYGRQIDNVRKALDWAFSSGGDAMLGVSLTEAALPLWMHLSLMNECRSRVVQSLSVLTSSAQRDLRLELQFQHALGAVLLNIEASGPELEAALNEALRIAEELDDTDYKLRVLWCLWCHALNRGALREALALADRFCDVATRSPDPVDPLTGERMRGFTVHFLGDQRTARRQIEYMLSRYVAPVHRAHIIRFQFDQKITARNFLVSILWLQGFITQALTMNATNVEEAQAFDHALTLCNSLAKGACLLSLMANDLPGAQHYIDLLLSRSARDGLPIWHAWGKCFRGILLIKQGDLATGLDLLQTTLAVLPENRFSLRHTWVFAEYAEGLRLAGRITEGLKIIDKALGMCERDEEFWCIAEVLRIKGELIQATGGKAADRAAEEHFRQSLDWARRQGALSWELRTALSLARCHQKNGRRRDARNLLAPIYGRFIEGFETTDLRHAKALIDELSGTGDG
ncbi:ATP-binding protein [Plastoroseomonas hellenica]|uniref:ATP-binding protein n=1 Tax=Plastoroseomonas hellenica TaxID=2687306 RepID=UPI001BAE0FBE|nr:winged helix-turn-helix domain-containing protein [Plastoroseomonas hellenica]MBR0646923.1 AAA family ATPase [Plastoroseomonas hellenica]